jgi:hypothetical protein
VGRAAPRRYEIDGSVGGRDRPPAGAGNLGQPQTVTGVKRQGIMSGRPPVVATAALLRAGSVTPLRGIGRLVPTLNSKLADLRPLRVEPSSPAFVAPRHLAQAALPERSRVTRPRVLRRFVAGRCGTRGTRRRFPQTRSRTLAYRQVCARGRLAPALGSAAGSALGRPARPARG